MTNTDLITPSTREYKSRLFIMLFSDREKLLELYNAVSGKNYQNPELLTINTLENAIYLSMKNDVSFLIDCRLSLYEHQSTCNPNMPLRFLLYLADLYSAFTSGKNMYGTRRIPIPQPEFIVFYNGKQEQPDVQELRLSDAYTASDRPPALELTVLMLNINAGHNQKLMEASRHLREYAEYVRRVRLYSEHLPIEDAVERAITECIQEGILREFLLKNRAEAKKVSIYEYNEEEHLRMEREESFERGRLAERENTERERKRAEAETRRADSEAQRADSEARRADSEAQRAEAAEAELQALKEELKRLKRP